MSQPADGCIFCKISSGDLPANVIFEDDQVIAFHDISPQAPTHALIIPKTHIANMTELEPSEHAALMGHLMITASQVAKTLGLG